MWLRQVRLACFFLMGLGSLPAAAETDQAGGRTPLLFQEHCAACHGGNRLGGTGPALLPGNLRRLKPEKAENVIASGRPATQMPAFAEALSAGPAPRATQPLANTRLTGRLRIGTARGRAATATTEGIPAIRSTADWA